MSELNGDIAKDALGSVAERVHDEANRAASAIADVGEKLEDHTTEAVERTAKTSESVRQNVSSGMEAIAGSAGDLGDRATGIVKRHPTRAVLVAAAVAAVLGFAAGVISSRRR